MKKLKLVSGKFILTDVLEQNSDIKIFNNINFIEKKESKKTPIKCPYCLTIIE